MAKTETPLLDDLEKGKWPSFVKDMKQAAEKKVMAKDLLRQLEQSYEDRIGHWKHGGIVGVKGYGGGVIGRYSDRPDLFPVAAAFGRPNRITPALPLVVGFWGPKPGAGHFAYSASQGIIQLAPTCRRGWVTGGST